MRVFKQLSNYMISDIESVKALALKDVAKLLVISDSHGSKNIITNIIENFGKDVDALCFCGDGMPDLLGMIEDSMRITYFEDKIPKVIIFVQGNGDNSNYSLLTKERLPIKVPQQLDFVAAGKKILITHGHRYNVYIGTKDLKNEAENINATIAFYGHTHIANAQKKTNSKTKSKMTILNPGSCSLPRGGLPHTFALVTLTKNVEKIDYNYFELKWDSNGEIAYAPYTPPTGEINLFW